MRGRRFAFLRSSFIVYIDLQAAYVIGDIGVLGDDLGQFAGPQTWQWTNASNEVVVKRNFSINVVFGNFGEDGVAFSAFLEGNQI